MGSRARTALVICSSLLLWNALYYAEAQTNTPSTPCPTGWKLQENYCYQVRGMSDNQAKAWGAGVADCRYVNGKYQAGGNLVSINSAAEQTAVYSLLRSNPNATNVASVYIGLNSRLSKGGYHWSDGSPVAYTHWRKGFQTRKGEECIVMATATGQWTDRECDELTGYICKRPKSGYAVPPPPITPDNGKFCQKDWVHSNGNCYQYNANKVTYAKAVTACRQTPGANLTSVNSIYEQAILLSMLGSGGVDVWIGLDDQAVEGSYQWKDGTPVTYSNWGFGEPNSWHFKADCTDFDSATGFWNDRFCGNTRGYVCKMSPDQATSQTSSVCASGWVSYNGHCYWLESGTDASKKLNYTAAESFCEGNSGYLVHINDKYENAFLAAAFPEHMGSTSYRMWMGINDMGAEGVYKSTDKWPIEFTSWRQGEPNDYRHGEDCTEFYARPTDHLVNGLWNDRTCSANLGYICEKRTATNPTSGPQPTAPATTSCAAGWQQWPNQNWCYKFDIPIRLSWTDARARCRQYGADLISIHSPEELSFVVTQFQQKKYGTIWFGLNDRNIEGGYTWSDGSPVQYTSWNRGEPNNYYGQEDCVQIYNSKKWNDLACGKQLNFGCKINIAKSVATPAATIQPYYNHNCDDGWNSHGPYCYLFEYGAKNEKTWQDAQTHCQSHSANLTSITSLDEEEFIANTILNTINNSAVTNRMWIGLTDNVKEGSYQWIDGSDFPFSYWNSGEPNNWRGDEDCGEIVRGQYWNDNTCTKTQPFICKKPRNGVTVRRPSLPNLPIWGTCPPGWMSLLDDPYCYIANKTVLSWPQAEMFCAGLFPNQSSHLASIVNTRESTFIATKVMPHFGFSGRNKNVWIGLNDRQIEHTYMWTDGLPVLVTSWWRGQPNDYEGTQNCVYMNSDQGRWNDLGCQNKRPFVCKMQKYPGPPPPLVEIECSDTYQSCVAKGCSKTTIVECPSGCDSYTSGIGSSVYGYQVYSADSGICRAAIQSGRTTSSGGNVTVIQLPGRSFYSEATQNGIISSSKDQAPGSFTFDFTDLPFKCQPGWISSGSSCYFFVANNPNSSKPYQNAMADCTKMDSHLVTITDDYENSFILSQLPGIAGNAWIGLSDESGAYIWSDGTPYSYKHWMRNEPNDYGGTENCVEIYPNKGDENGGRWNDEQCQKTRGYICEKIGVNETLPYVPPTSGGLACPKDWTVFGTHCYYVVPDESSSEQKDLPTWSQARDKCMAMNSQADLLSINSLTEFKFVREWIHGIDWRQLWVGLNDQSKTGSYVWSDGSSSASVGYYWDTSQPEKNGKQPCVQINTANGRLVDKKCDETFLAYACKAPRTGSSVSGGLSGGAIAGVIFGVLLGIAAAVAVFFVVRRRLKTGGGSYSLMSGTKFESEGGEGDDGLLPGGEDDDDDDDAPVDP
eukprot:m.264678 g.264678  ORF g.264678 m.264678 type:complete len:1411 (+) comp40476_c0_seq1:1691-5923(+)